jgi:hypothetical protein
MSQILYLNKHEIDFVAYIVSSKTIIRFVDDSGLMICSCTRPFNTSSLQFKQHSHDSFSSDCLSNSLSNDLSNSLSNCLSHIISFWISVSKIAMSLTLMFLNCFRCSLPMPNFPALRRFSQDSFPVSGNKTGKPFPNSTLGIHLLLCLSAVLKLLTEL